MDGPLHLDGPRLEMGLGHCVMGEPLEGKVKQAFRLTASRQAAISRNFLASADAWSRFTYLKRLEEVSWNVLTTRSLANNPRFTIGYYDSRLQNQVDHSFDFF